MIELLRGRVEPGVNDASKWLSLFNAAYSRKLGMPVFPGSLNLRLTEPFDWLASRYEPNIIRFGKAEYGGERDILLLRCNLASLEGRRAFLWTPIHPILGVGMAYTVEIVADIKLRAAYGLTDGALVEVELDVVSLC
jgi:CTP-dependent riboflavin kinase